MRARRAGARTGSRRSSAPPASTSTATSPRSRSSAPACAPSRDRGRHVRRARGGRHQHRDHLDLVDPGLVRRPARPGRAGGAGRARTLRPGERLSTALGGATTPNRPDFLTRAQQRGRIDVAVGSRRLAVVLVPVCCLAGAAVAVGATGVRQVQTVPLPRATGIAVSPGGRLVVARSGVGSLGTLTVFRRAATGKLTRLQCVTRHARRCLDGRGLETPSAIAIPRDGTNLYVTAANGRSVGSYRIVGGKLALAGSVAGLVASALGRRQPGRRDRLRRRRPHLDLRPRPRRRARAPRHDRSAGTGARGDGDRGVRRLGRARSSRTPPTGPRSAAPSRRP